MNSHQTLNTSFSPMQLAYPTNSAISETQKAPVVLVAGKEAETRLLYRFFLESWNFTVIEADCFEEIVNITGHLEPELILMDGELSLKGDLETIRKIRGTLLLHNTPLVLTSGHAQAKARDLALVTGADDYLVKQLNFNELHDSLRRTIEEIGASRCRGKIS